MSDSKKAALEAQLALLPPEKRAALLERLAKSKTESGSKATKGGAASKDLPLERRSESGPPAASYAQQRLWFLEQFAPGTTAYNVPDARRMRGLLDRTAMTNAIEDVVARHEALRTAIRLDAKASAVQIIEDVKPVVEVLDLTGLPPEQREVEARKRVQEVADEPFKLDAPPLLRALLVALSDEDHVLLIVVHHIATDAWSTSVLWRDLAAFYRARARGRDADVVPLSIQYADYSEWQRRWLDGGRVEGQLAYWRKQLENVSPLELPTNRPRPPVQTNHGAHFDVEIPEPLLARAEAAARSVGGTLFMVLFAAYATLMHRYSTQEDVAIGIPIANRQRPELEQLVGFFVNSLVLRTGFGGNPTAREVLERVRKTALDAYANQDLPFDRLVEDIHPQRILSRSPLIQVMFAVGNTPPEGKLFEGLAVEPFRLTHTTAKFDVSVDVARDSNGRMQMFWQYRTDLFDAPFIERMSAHYLALLEAFTGDLDVPIARLPMLSAAERKMLVTEWNDTKRDYPYRPLHQTFEAQVAKTPDAVAIIADAKKVTYRELDERANKLAHHLLSLGTKPGQLVGISMDRSIELMVAIFGVLKAGAAYAPIDPENPRDRLAFMIEDAAVSTLLTQEHVKPKLPASPRTRMIALDTEWSSIDGHPSTTPGITPAPTSLAYIVYTSGSTGRPKAAMNTQVAVANRLAWQQETFKLTEKDAVLHKTAIGFDLAVWESIWPLLNGARLVIAKAGGQRDFVYQISLIREHRVTFLHLMPSVIPIFVDLPGFEEWSKTIRQVVTGGEAISVESHDLFFARSKASLANYYGPSECAIDVAGFICERGSKRAIIPIGRPIGNIQLHVVDANLELTPVGVPGELLVGGIGVGRGYLARPDLTAKSFIPDPFSGVAGARLYRTGDLVRRAEDGTIEFLGRIDHQVKLRGFRIELGEIEAALTDQAGVRTAVVIVREDSPGDKELVAYLVLDDSVPRDSVKTTFVPALKKAIGAKLPEHMVPPSFVVLDKLPTTITGKVDRRNLPAPERGRNAAVAYAEPQTTTEKLLAAIWADLLRVPRVGLNDNFFELGGHSLLAMRLVTQIREKLLVEVPVRKLFEAPTLGAFAEVVDSADPVASNEPLERLPRGPGVTFPLSYEQESFWRWERANPGTRTWIGPGAIEIKGPVDVAALSSAIDEIVRRHESLRTHFVIVEGRPMQTIDESVRPLEIVDVRERSDAERDAALARMIDEENDRSFDLTKGPLFVSRLLRLADTRHILFITSHHTVVGGKWFSVLVEELAALYPAFLRGTPSPLGELPFQYVDYAVWYRRRVEGPALGKRLTHWSRKLEGAQPTLLPREPGAPIARGATRLNNLPFKPPAGTMEAIEELAKAEKVTAFAIVLGSVAVLLHRHTGQDDIVIAAPTDRRTDMPDACDAMIAMFTTHSMFRIDLRGAPTFSEVLQRVKATLLEASEYELPLAAILHENVSPLDDPMMRVVCNFMPSAANAPSALTAADITLADFHLPERHRVRKDVLLFLLGRGGDRLGGRILFPDGLMDAHAGAALVAEFVELVTSLIKDPAQKIARSDGQG